MIELLEKIETILAAAPEQQTTDGWSNDDSEVPPYHPLTSWTGDRIAQALSKQLPEAKSPREKEALHALQYQKYSRCKIYLQLVEESAYIKAIDRLSRIPKAVEEGLLTLPTLFKEGARAIGEAYDQRVATSGDTSKVKEQREAALASLEKLSIDVFARGLGDEEEQ